MELATAWADWGLFGLFWASFLAATLLPFSSEAVVAACTLGPWSFVELLAVATAGNWLGGMSTYGLGRLGEPARIARWLRSDPVKVERWRNKVERHGVWLALLCWLPVLGDPLALALGLGRSKALPTALLMLVGKSVRYALVLWSMRGL